MRATVLVEHSSGKVADTVRELCALASGLGMACHGIVCGGDVAEIQSVAAQLRGFASVTGIADPQLASYNPDAVLTALRAAVAAEAPDLVLMSYSTAGIDMASSLAWKTGGSMVGYVVALAVEGAGLTALSQVYGGKLRARTFVPLPAIVAVMPGATKPDLQVQGLSPPTVSMLAVDLSGVRTRVRELVALDTSGVDLADADKIFCVGRALGGVDRLEVAKVLAHGLGAELAGSRPVIDAGWMPKARQIGKSGTKVKPKLYLMAGVSGAPEHLEGMQDSELIIALNSDEKAPIFRAAHYGAVCDMFQVMPALIKRLRAGN